ncbi:Ppx/GppA phosphatase family protein [Desulfoscipio geothermicus]|uniref:Exopolyphosphatase / guanosine-5'-triphosphate,3'-diphosphate pyrophosphatase n=1 Tax=Desulfoscipio geothermicus DSM 3669 TaxID=1121426 RepID=A0A1I6DG92_9FIRM|nr:Ppx/GppA phosphatase family protein [Desulfoscipio geothermicus]SFR04500.1 exopolyphosphatase / guanosine-5'-triphosphate,3'-diphosphate pyrophosphatase [Desulfoscipio geothermicus DSM 3669]
MRIAAIDVGSNSIRLLVADAPADGVITPVLRDLQTTRLGQGFAGGRLADAAVHRTLDVIKDFVRQARRAGAEKVVLAATSAVRDAANREDFIHAVYGATGYALRVLSGEEEARLSYLGVTGALGDVRDALVIDIGGGSTEFIWPGQGGIRFRSVNAGAVRMTESGFGSGQIRAVFGDILRDIRPDSPADMIGVGGTVTTLAAMAQEMRTYDPDKVHGYRLTAAKVGKLYHALRKLPVAARQKMPGLQPERADIIPAGALILLRVLQGLNMDSVLVSEADILYGLIIWEAREMS